MVGAKEISTKNGTFSENRLDFLHPSIGSRIRKIEDTLRKKNVEINEQEESEKIDKLKNWMNENNLKVLHELQKLTG